MVNGIKFVFDVYHRIREIQIKWACH